jgi:2,4'-dihydroxyacetophenone dioxygenase
VITVFNFHGSMVYVDGAGNTSGYEDAFTKIAPCRKQYADKGLGAAYVDQYIH